SSLQTDRRTRLNTVGSLRGSPTRRGAGGAGHARLHHDRLSFFARQRLAEAALHCLAALDSLNPFLVALAWTAAFAALASLIGDSSLGGAGLAFVTFNRIGVHAAQPRGADPPWRSPAVRRAVRRALASGFADLRRRESC